MEQGTIRLKTGLAEMLKGGVIMDVTTPEQAKIAEEAGACAVMALERVPADIRAAGGIARMGEDLRRPLEEHVHKYAWTPWGHPDIRLAEKPEASVVLGLHKLTLDEIAGKTAL